MTTSHGKIKTPFFMPCATVGVVKGVSSEELQEIGYEIILANTYHLYLRPGEKAIKKLGGLHRFMNWDKPILTDSGGYQVFSLGKNFKDYAEEIQNAALVNVNKDGVWFKSHLDGSKHFFTPEKVIDIQLRLGSNIIMPLDYCPSAEADKKEIKKAVSITNVWFDRAWGHFNKQTKNMQNRPAIFGIIQGGFYKDLRKKSFDFLSQFEVDGFAVGGVANGGESKLKQRRALEYTAPFLPKNKPCYLMGVGEPEDIIYAIKYGFDMFDCVLPTRLGRHGTVWVTSNWKTFKKIDLRKSQYRQDKKVMMENCRCPACSAGYSRAYIGHLIKSGEMLGMRLASLHNLWIINELIKRIRQSI